MDVIIRAMSTEDWSSVAEIYQEGIDGMTSTFHRELPPYEVWNQTYKEECRLVAVEQDKVIGWTAIQPISSRAVYSGVAEVSIYIKKEYHGRSVGEKLFQALIVESEHRGYWTLQSSIFEVNKASIRLHEKIGFRMVGYRERIGKDRNGVWQNTVLMERRSKVL